MTRYITHVTLPNDSNTYEVKDAAARDSIADLEASLGKALRYRGSTSSTTLYDGSTATSFSGVDMTPGPFRTGDVVLKTGSGTGQNAPTEYIYDGSKWNEFGSTGSLGKLAFYDKVRGTGSPAGTVGVASAGEMNTSPVLKGNTYTLTSSYQPSGEVEVTVTDTELTVNTSGTIPDAVSVTVGSTTSNNYIPGGSISQPTFSGVSSNVNIQGVATTVSPNYTPAGTILCNGATATAPTVSISLNTASAATVSSVGTLPSLSYTVTGEELLITWSPGTLPTTATRTFATSVSSAVMGELTFQGAGALLTGTVTPKGTVSTPSFTGTGTTIKATLTGSKTTTFSGTVTPKTHVSATFTGNSAVATGSITPSSTGWYVGPLSLNMNQLTIESTPVNS